MTALATFLATAKRIESAIDNIAAARRIPEHRVAIARSVEVRTPTWSVPAVQAEATEAAAALRAKLAADYQAAGEAARDARIAEIAAELNALRAILPQQAAAASIELGHQARMLQHEANGGTV